MPRLFNIVFVLSLLTISLHAQKSLLEETTGDLDGDGVKERIVIYSYANDSTDVQTREIHILKKTDTDWQLWQQFEGGILPAISGLRPQEPFVSMEIKEGQLILYHAYSGTDQWSYSHYFRLYQDKMELVRAKISFGVICEGFTQIDFDLLTGLLSYKQETDNCGEGAVNQVLIDKKELVYLDELPLLQGFIPGDNEIKVPATDLVFYY